MQANMNKLTGGAAVGAALAVLYTHGGDYTLEEVTALAAGAGAAVTYLANLAELLILGRDIEGSEA